jgi:Na+/proline symporter
MSAVEALSSSDVTKIGVSVIIALVVLGALLSFIITAIVGRIIVLIVVIVLGVVVWQQRNHVKDELKKCPSTVTFFGVNLDVPKDVVRACKAGR